MYLKRLEMMGFKSFADKMKLQFLPGITAIVGPNGSGKSNISDALRWVLGEQSVKSLRGAKMDDVIFAGSEQRKALGMAEVTIILDNSEQRIPVDFTEIAVTRRLFRSGESEYLLNKAPVRLKDIHELFFDTGLGKEAYSVIGQGKIDSILSVKAEERRLIFEEAAGIIKYKTRKQVAERKLNDTDQNLLRVQDILNELTTQLGPLEVQAKLAEEFLALKAELASLEVNYNGNLLNKLESSLTEFLEKQVSLQKKAEELRGEENVIQSEIETKKLALLNQDNLVTNLNEAYYQLKNLIEKQDVEAKSLQGRIADLQKQQIEYQAALENNQQRSSEITIEVNEVTEAELALQERIRQLERDVFEGETALVKETEILADHEKQSESLKETIINLLSEIANLKNKINTADLQKDFVAKQVAEARKKERGLTLKLQDFEQQAVAKKTALDELGNLLWLNHQEETALIASQESLARESVGLERENQQSQNQLHGLETKIQMLDDLEKSYQGYFQGVKALLADAAGESFYRGIKGIVADLMRVAAGMELAIETALGSNLQNIVIENSQYAEAAVAYLKRTAKGRATFLPLNLIRSTDSRITRLQSLLEEHGCRPAVSALQFREEYETLFNYLLGQTIIAPDLKIAVQLSTRLERGFRIVTPEGDVVNPGGAITGGSIDKRRLGILSRRREIENLKAAAEELRKGLAQGRAAWEKNQAERQLAIVTLEKQKQEEKELQIKQATLEREYATILDNLSHFEEERALYQQQVDELDAETTQYTCNREELIWLCQEKEAQLKQREVASQELTGVISEQVKARERAINQIADLRASLSGAREEERGKVSLKKRLERQKSEFTGIIMELKQKITTLAGEEEKLFRQFGSLTQNYEQQQQNLKREETQIEEERQKKAFLNADLKELENRERNFRKKWSGLAQELHQLELSINQTELQVTNIRNNLQETYGENWSAGSDPNWQAIPNAPKEIDLLKQRIRGMGSVNTAAIEDLRQVQERAAFLAEQSEDLVQAKAALQKVIKEIERTIVKRFNESFLKIREEFKRLFGELFAGGHAELFLAEPDNPLASGIEITAQPPGKRLQSLSLLSGGERAMTAIALLFAILTVKPSPFCVLDEIDAALDEVNVQRFAKLLQLFSDKVQFIVVTHRHTTMSIANALYGITMEERGVSKLISLDLDEKVG